MNNIQKSKKTLDNNKWITDIKQNPEKKNPKNKILNHGYYR